MPSYATYAAEAEGLYRTLLQPGSGRLVGAFEPCPSRSGDIAFAGLTYAELRGPFQQTRLCLREAESGRIRVLTPAGGTDLTPRFHPDRRLLAFRSDRGRAGEQQLWFYDLDRSALRRGPGVPGVLETLHWSPNGARLMLLVAPYGSDTAGAHGSSPSVEQGGSNEEDWRPRVRSSAEAGRSRSVWLTSGEGAAERLTAEGLNIWEAAWCGPQAIVAIASPGTSEDDWYKARIVIIDLADEKPLPAYTPQRQLGALSGAPEGRWVAFVEAVCSDRALVAGDLMLLDRSSGQARRIATEGVDIAFTAFASERSLLVLGVRGPELVAGAVDLPAGRFRALSSRRGVYGTSHYPVLAPWPGRENACAIAVQGFSTPPEIGIVDGDGYRSLSSFAPEQAQSIAELMGEVREVAWTAADGLEIAGYLIGADRGSPGPLVMDIHGGPISLWYPYWPGRHAHHLMLRRRGYRLLLPNPRGSAGRGQDFAAHVFGGMGGAGDTGDLIAGLDAMTLRGIADPRRIGVMGLSYGGFMTSWLVTQDPRFAAAVAIAPITNWLSQHFTCNIPSFDNDFLGGDCFDPAGPHLARSPALLARKVRTPTLLICGDQDHCTPASQALEFYNALKEVGVRTELVTYPKEGHGARSFPAMIDFAARVTAWFEEHVPR